MPFYPDSHHASKKLMSGGDEVLKTWHKGVAMSQELTRLNRNYPILGIGINSNSTVSSYLDGMGLPRVNMKGIDFGKAFSVFHSEDIEKFKQYDPDKGNYHQVRPLNSLSPEDKKFNNDHNYNPDEANNSNENNSSKEKVAKNYWENKATELISSNKNMELNSNDVSVG